MWLWIGLAVIGVLLFALWYTRATKEPFQNTTGKASSFVVSSTLQALTTPANLQTIGTLEKGSYLDSYAIKTIENIKGEVLWKAGDPLLSDTVQAQYRITFPNDVTISTPPPAGAGGPDTPGKFQTGLPSGIVYAGLTFTSPFLIVQSTITELADPYYLRLLSSFGTGKQDAAYKVTKISDESGKIFYTWSNAAERFKLVFASPISLKLFQNALDSATDKVDSAGKVTQTANATYVNLGFKRITLKGADFSSSAPDLTATSTTAVVEIADDPNVAVEGKLSVLVNPAVRDVFKTFGDGSPNVTSIQTANGTTVWSADEKATKYRLDFAAPIDLDKAKDMMPRKFATTRFVGLKFADSPATPVSYTDRPIYQEILKGMAAPDERMAQLLGDQAGMLSQDDQIAQDFLTSNPVQTKTSTDTSKDSNFVYKFTNSSSQDIATVSDVSTDATIPTGPVLVTNRIKVRTKFSTLVTPEVLKTLERGAGVTADGKAPTVVEILDETEKRIWPPTAGSRYVDPEIDSIYIIGYDAMIDVQNTIQPYIIKYMPSIAFMNPALPRQTTKTGSA